MKYLFSSLLLLSLISVKAEVHTVEIINFTYVPYNLTIRSGDEVLWINRDDAEHTATSGEGCGYPDGIFDSGYLGYEESYSFTFESAGTYPYYCIPHCGQKGNIIVETITGQANSLSGSSDKIFPNPTTDLFKLSLTSKYSSEENLRVYDPKGILIFEKKVVISEGENQLTINLSSLPDNTYYVILVLNNRKRSWKVVKE